MARGRQPELKGMDLTLQMFKVYKSMATPAAAATMRLMAERVLAQSLYYVPRETGSLAASATMTQIDEVSWRLSYGVLTGQVAAAFGMEGVLYRDPFYAIFVHEDLSKKHEPPTQAKYLERAVNEIVPVMAEENGDNFRKALDKAQYGGVDAGGSWVARPGWTDPWRSGS